MGWDGMGWEGLRKSKRVGVGGGLRSGKGLIVLLDWVGWREEMGFGGWDYPVVITVRSEVSLNTRIHIDQ